MDTLHHYETAPTAARTTPSGHDLNDYPVRYVAHRAGLSIPLVRRYAAGTLPAALHALLSARIGVNCSEADYRQFQQQRGLKP